MPFADLREFIAHLEKHGQLRRVTAPVSRDLEISEITDRISKSSGDKNVALLFENVRGFSVPVLINAFGSAERMRRYALRRLASRSSRPRSGSRAAASETAVRSASSGWQSVGSPRSIASTGAGRLRSASSRARNEAVSACPYARESGAEP